MSTWGVTVVLLNYPRRNEYEIRFHPHEILSPGEAAKSALLFRSWKEDPESGEYLPPCELARKEIDFGEDGKLLAETIAHTLEAPAVRAVLDEAITHFLCPSATKKEEEAEKQHGIHTVLFKYHDRNEYALKCVVFDKDIRCGPMQVMKFEKKEFWVGREIASENFYFGENSALVEMIGCILNSSAIQQMFNEAITYFFQKLAPKMP